MEQDQEDFERDQRASNNIAENLDFFGNDGVLGQSNLVHESVPASSIPLAESAYSNIESADLLPSLDEFNDFDFLFGPSELPAPTQTTSSMQMPQSAIPTDDEHSRFVNLDADASYTDHHPSESLAPIATANSVPVAQSTVFAGHDMSPFNYMDAPYANIDPQQLLAPTTATGLVQATQSAAFTENDRFSFDHMDLDAPYSDIDPSQFLASTTTTGFEQAAQSADLMEDGTSRIIELDPDPVMAPSGPAPKSTEQLPPPVSTDRVFPAEIAQSANSMTNFNGSDPPTASNLTSHPPPLASPSNNTITTMSAPGKQLQLELENSFPSRVYVPLRPKAAAISQSTELPSTSEPQDSSLLRFPSQGTLASRPASSVVKGKRKRQCPSDIPKGMPENCFHMFQMIGNSEAAKEEQQQQPVTKRTRSARTCLRCQMYRKRCSGRFPCENCAIHFAHQAMKRPGETLQWKHCFDSDILQVNVFNEINIPMSNPSKKNELSGCTRDENILMERGAKAAAQILETLDNPITEAAISHLFGPQVHRFVLAISDNHVPSVPTLLSTRDLLPTTSLRRQKICSHHPPQTCGLPWSFVVAILQPDYLADLAGFSKVEIQEFTLSVCEYFYWGTCKLLQNVRTPRKGTVEEDRAALLECLEMIYCLIAYHDVQNRLNSRYAMAANQAISQQTDLLMELDARLGNDTNFVSTVIKEFGKVTKTTLMSVRENIKWQELYHSAIVQSIRGEGWDHLQAFTRHWLWRLKGGRNRYGRVILLKLRLDMLSRINHKDEIEDEGQVQPKWNAQVATMILEARASSLALHPRGNETSKTRVFKLILADFEKLANNMSLLCPHKIGMVMTFWLQKILDNSERAVTEKEARKGSNGLKDYWLIRADDFPDDRPDLKQSHLDNLDGLKTRLGLLERALDFFISRLPLSVLMILAQEMTPTVDSRSFTVHQT